LGRAVDALRQVTDGRIITYREYACQIVKRNERRRNRGVEVKDIAVGPGSDGGLFSWFGTRTFCGVG